MKSDKELYRFLFKKEKFSFHKNFLFIFLSFFISLSIIIISFSIFKYIKLNYEYNIEFRTLTVFKDLDYVGFENYIANKEKYIDELLKMNHIIGVYDSDDYEIQGKISNLNNYDGYVTIIGLQEKTLNSLFKISFKKLEGNKLICPLNFIPDSSIYESNITPKKPISLSGENLNINFTKFVDEKPIENLTRIFTIYETYSSEENYQYNNVCFTHEKNLQDIKKEIVNYTDPEIGISSFVVLIDNYKNIENVITELQDNHFVAKPSFHLDIFTINLVTVICIIIFIISMLTLFINIKYVVKKYLVQNTSIISILSAIGYSNQRIFNLYLKKIMLMIFKISLVSIIFVYIIAILINKYILVFSLTQGLKLYYNSLALIVIISFILLLIYILIRYYFKNVFNISISSSIKENI